MIPPHGEERIEVHAHWEEILLNKLKDIRFPNIKILNMAQVRKNDILPLVLTFLLNTIILHLPSYVYLKTCGFVFILFRELRFTLKSYFYI